MRPGCGIEERVGRGSTTTIHRQPFRPMGQTSFIKTPMSLSLETQMGKGTPRRGSTRWIQPRRKKEGRKKREMCPDP